jgi:hypothetical protein
MLGIDTPVLQSVASNFTRLFWFIRSRDSSVSIAMGYGLNGRSSILYSTESRPALGPTQPPNQWVPAPLSPGVKRPGREADHSPPSSDVKNGGALPPLLHTSSRRSASLIKPGDNFTFLFWFINRTKCKLNWEGIVLMLKRQAIRMRGGRSSKPQRTRNRSTRQIWFTPL